MWWLLLLPHAVLSAGIYINHIQKYLNTSVNPCDNFFGHVCSSFYDSDGPADDAVIAHLTKTIEPFISKNYLEIRKLIDSALNKTAADLTIDKPGGFSLKMEAFELLVNIDAANSFIDTEKFKKKEETIVGLFETMRKTVLANFKSAPWANKKPHFIWKLETVKLFRYVAENSSFDRVVQDAKNAFSECISSKGAPTREYTFSCAVESLDISFKAVLSEQKSFTSIMIKKSLVEGFNAGYDPEGNIIGFFLPYITYDYEEVPFMLGSLLQTMGHELSHVFFDGNNFPSNSDCFQDQMFETCELFFKEEGKCQIYKTKNTLSEDASDWVAWKSAVWTLQNSKYYSKEAMRQLFFAKTINYCGEPISDNVHSPNIVRINGLFRMNKDFASAFDCKKGDRMVQEKKCQPFTGEGSPEYKKKAFF